MQAGYELIEDNDIEEAKKMGYLVRAYQGNITIYPPGKITGYSTDHVAIDGKRLLRSANNFQIMDKSKI
jgi:hypothetical protein